MTNDQQNKKPPDAWGGRGLIGRSSRTFEEPFQLSAPHRMLELPDGLGLDLSHTLARDLEDPAHFLEGIGVAVAQAVTQLDDLALAVGQGLEDLVDLLLEHLLGRGIDRALG